jgi:excisionase family DNA binding protein
MSTAFKSNLPADVDRQFENAEVPPAFDVRTAARLLSVSPRTVELLIASGQLASLHIGRCRRIRRVDLEDFLARQVAAEVELEQVEALPAEALRILHGSRVDVSSQKKTAGRAEHRQAAKQMEGRTSATSAS